MEFIYNLHGFNLKNGNCFENVDFSSKKKALDSLAYLREHWIKKLDLDTSNIINVNTTYDDNFSVVVDDTIRVSLSKKYIYKQVINYI